MKTPPRRRKQRLSSFAIQAIQSVDHVAFNAELATLSPEAFETRYKQAFFDVYFRDTLMRRFFEEHNLGEPEPPPVENIPNWGKLFIILYVGEQHGLMPSDSLKEVAEKCFEHHKNAYLIPMYIRKPVPPSVPQETAATGAAIVLG